MYVSIGGLSSTTLVWSLVVGFCLDRIPTISNWQEWLCDVMMTCGHYLGCSYKSPPTRPHTVVKESSCIQWAVQHYLWPAVASSMGQLFAFWTHTALSLTQPSGPRFLHDLQRWEMQCWTSHCIGLRQESVFNVAMYSTCHSVNLEGGGRWYPGNYIV